LDLGEGLIKPRELLEAKQAAEVIIPSRLISPFQQSGNEKVDYVRNNKVNTPAAKIAQKTPQSNACQGHMAGIICSADSMAG
jgi:hypothetical protein